MTQPKSLRTNSDSISQLSGCNSSYGATDMESHDYELMGLEEKFVWIIEQSYRYSTSLACWQEV